MRRVLATTAVTAAACGYLVQSEVRRRLRLAQDRRRTAAKTREALKDRAWLKQGLRSIQGRLSESEEPVFLTLSVRDLRGGARHYTAKQDSGHVVVSVRRVER